MQRVQSDYSPKYTPCVTSKEDDVRSKMSRPTDILLQPKWFFFLTFFKVMQSKAEIDILSCYFASKIGLEDGSYGQIYNVAFLFIFLSFTKMKFGLLHWIFVSQNIWSCTTLWCKRSGWAGWESREGSCGLEVAERSIADALCSPSESICHLSTVNNSSFGIFLSTYLCEDAISQMKIVRARYRRRLTNQHLWLHLCLRNYEPSFSNFYCCTVHFDNTYVLITNKCTSLLQI